jgi:hypothetical protein
MPLEPSLKDKQWGHINSKKKNLRHVEIPDVGGLQRK